jgi:hypothetical protein
MKTRSSKKQASQQPRVAADLLSELKSAASILAQDCSVSSDTALDELLAVALNKLVTPLLEDLLQKTDSLQKEVNELRAKYESVPEQQAAKATEDKTWVDVVKKLQQDVSEISARPLEATAKLVRSPPSWGPPTPTAFRLQPLPNMGKQLETNRSDSVAQVNGVIRELGLHGDLVEVHPPRPSKVEGQATSPRREGRKRGTAGTVFTMNPASAISFMSQLRKQEVVGRLRSMGWSIRLQLPVEQYRCKCALYNEHTALLQGKKFHYVDQYTTMVVEGGVVFKLSPAQLLAIRSA